MKVLKWIFVIVLFQLVSCTLPPEKEVVESKLRNMNELGTSEYVLNKIIIAEDSQWYTLGDKQVIISMKASLKAGIDFSQIKILELNSFDKAITLDVPKSKILLLDIKPKDIEYKFVNVAFSRYNFTNEELSEIQVLGENSIREQLKKLKILQDADNNAKIFLLNWFKSIGFEQIKFTKDE